MGVLRLPGAKWKTISRASSGSDWQFHNLDTSSGAVLEENYRLPLSSSVSEPKYALPENASSEEIYELINTLPLASREPVAARCPTPQARRKEDYDDKQQERAEKEKKEENRFFSREKNFSTSQGEKLLLSRRAKFLEQPTTSPSSGAILPCPLSSSQVKQKPVHEVNIEQHHLSD